MRTYKIKLSTFVFSLLFLFTACTKQEALTPQEKLTQHADAVVPILFNFPNEDTRALYTYILQFPENASNYVSVIGSDAPSQTPLSQPESEKELLATLASHCTEDGSESILPFYYSTNYALAPTNYYVKIKSYTLEDYSDRQVKITVLLELYEIDNSNILKEYTVEATVQYADDSGLINHFRLLPSGEKAMMQLYADVEENSYIICR